MLEGDKGTLFPHSGVHLWQDSEYFREWLSIESSQNISANFSVNAVAQVHTLLNEDWISVMVGAQDLFQICSYSTWIFLVAVTPCPL